MKTHVALIVLGLSVLFSRPASANICGISAGLVADAEETLKKKCADITESDLAKIKKLTLRRSTPAEKCGRPEVFYKQDLKLFKGVTDLTIYELPMTQEQARYYLKTKDDGQTKPGMPSSGRFGPCVLYGGGEEKWPLMFKVIDARGEAGVADIAQTRGEILEHFPNLTSLYMYPFDDKEPLEPLIRKLKSLKKLSACPTPADKHETVFAELGVIESLTSDACFLASKNHTVPKLGPSETLKSVKFEENKWKEIPADFFSGTPNIESVNFSKTEVAKLPPGLFSNLKKLKKVNLKWMKLSNEEKERVRQELLTASPGLKAKKAIQL